MSVTLGDFAVVAVVTTAAAVAYDVHRGMPYTRRIKKALSGRGRHRAKGRHR